MIRKHSADLEADLRELGFDLRDWWREGGGEKQLTTRVLVQIILKNLNRDSSRFWCAAEGRDPFYPLEFMVADIARVNAKDYVYPLQDKFINVSKYNERMREALEEQIEAQERRENGERLLDMADLIFTPDALERMKEDA